ncbi:hypothetical protein SKAU_G00314400 [Synaphobranchus kaupii]|uniref:Uncharacterized protein n=1 Tax=Synaphobranchus kaupii TaxID=118154 RepID=A0A9Q1IKL8_SYNKA|nr:hypothetical protein SKAU_G00314400 [Synaphobranchus kaupii]
MCLDGARLGPQESRDAVVGDGVTRAPLHRKLDRVRVGLTLDSTAAIVGSRAARSDRYGRTLSSFFAAAISSSLHQDVGTNRKQVALSRAGIRASVRAQNVLRRPSPFLDVEKRRPASCFERGTTKGRPESWPADDGAVLT